MADNNKNIEQNGATTHPEDNGGQPEGKMFTQDEVNRIVSERLARERSKLSDQTELEAREQTVSIKEKALNDRIIKLELQSLDGYDHKLLERLIDLSGVKVDEAGTVTGLKEAVEYCREKAEPGDAVLLSPACASWDMNQNFEQRGDHFKECVERLQK